MRKRSLLRNALIVVSFASPAVAATTPAAKCYTAQLQAMGSLCKAHAKCWATATGSDTANACVDLALEAKSLEKITKAEAKLECIAEGQALFDLTTADLAEGVSALHDLVDPGALGDACGAKKLKAAGKYCASFLKCRAKDYSTSGAKPAPACIAQAATKLEKSYGNAEAKGCATTGDADDSALLIDSSAAEPVAAAYLGAATSTTSTTSTTTTSSSTSTSSTSTSSTTTSTLAPPSFATDIYPLFTTDFDGSACIYCHTGLFPPGGLNLDGGVASAHTLLLAASTVSMCATTRVIPFDPDASVLLLRLKGFCSGESQEPFGGPFWTSTVAGLERLSAVELWIEGGALP